MGTASSFVLMLAVSLGGGASQAPTHIDPGPLPPRAGDVAPDCTSLDDQGEPWKLSQQVSQGKYLVLFFFPGDFKFCASRQVQKYRDALPALAARDVAVVGVSGDSVATHRLFKQVHGLGFPLLSDPEGRLAEAFGVPLRRGGSTPACDAQGVAILGADGKTLRVERGVTPRRWTFIIGPGGRILYRGTQVSATGDARAVREFIDGLESGSTESAAR